MKYTEITAHAHHDDCRCDVSRGIDVRYDCARCGADIAMLIAPGVPVDLLYCSCGFRLRIKGDLYERVVGD